MMLGLVVAAVLAVTSPIPVGHRGMGGPDENTLVALARDRDAGTRFETDVWNLAAPDGTPNAGPPVIFHDPTIRRTVPAQCRQGLPADTYIGDVTLTQFRGFCSNGGHPLPTLHEWVNHAIRWHVRGMVEVKYRLNHPDRFARWVRGTGISAYATPHYWYGTCVQDSMAGLRDLGVTVGLKVNSLCPQSLLDTAAFGYRYVIGPQPTPGYVTRAHTLGIKVGNYNNGRRDVWQQLVGAGVDYILAPHPGRLNRWLTHPKGDTQ